MERFSGSFTQQEPICEAGIAAAVAVMRHGRLHRYNTLAGEISETAQLEAEFAAFSGAKYALAVASGGYALGCALRACGLAAGEPVLTNAFTLAPVPGAIVAAGGEPVFVEITQDLVIDLDDLVAKVRATGARLLLLSHMRGHICDMQALMEVAGALDLIVIEDCAHTMGARVDGLASGRHGVIGCYSTQTYKHMNSGEGGLIVTDDPDLAAKMILLSGSYMLYGTHPAAPEPEVFEAHKYLTPNVSGRMDNLRAAILRPQIALLADRQARWCALYRGLETALADLPALRLIARPSDEALMGSSFQFALPQWEQARIIALLAACAGRGVELKWFGAGDPVAFTSRYVHWAYAGGQSCPQTDAILAGLIDLRLPLTFSAQDIDLIGRIIAQEVTRIAALPEVAPSQAPLVQ